LIAARTDKHSHGIDDPFIDGLPIKNGWIFHGYVKKTNGSWIVKYSQWTRNGEEHLDEASGQVVGSRTSHDSYTSFIPQNEMGVSNKSLFLTSQLFLGYCDSNPNVGNPHISE